MRALVLRHFHLFVGGTNAPLLNAALPEASPDGSISSVLFLDTGCAALLEAVRDAAASGGCSALSATLSSELRRLGL